MLKSRNRVSASSNFLFQMNNAEYPVTSPQVPLNTTAYALTTITNNSEQVAEIKSSGTAGQLGAAVILSPQQPTASDIHLQAGDQKLVYSLIVFTPASGLQGGSVVASGTVTDPQGDNQTTFTELLLCAWPNND
jgi:hypothetical protein